MSDLRPTTNRAELHLLYACDLDCTSCTRGSFLRSPHTRAMTWDDVREFFRQADELEWRPRIILTGGEPTLHPDFEGMLDACFKWSGEPVQVFSNHYGTVAKEKLLRVRHTPPASVTPETHKESGAVRSAEDYPGWVDDTFVSPADLGKPLRPPCYQHASVICGVSVDAEGYAPCSIGGALDALLGVGGRTRRLADLFDAEKVAAMTEALCSACGFQGVVQGIFSREEVDAQERRFGSPMSPTWQRAFEGRR